MKVCATFAGDVAAEREVDLPRKCAPPDDDQPGPVLECELAKLLVVWKTFRCQAKVQGPVSSADEYRVRDVSAIARIHAQDNIVLLQDRVECHLIGLAT